jgi:hypothetical protein
MRAAIAPGALDRGAVESATSAAEAVASADAACVSGEPREIGSARAAGHLEQHRSRPVTPQPSTDTASPS